MAAEEEPVATRVAPDSDTTHAPLVVSPKHGVQSDPGSSQRWQDDADRDRPQGTVVYDTGTEVQPRRRTTDDGWCEEFSSEMRKLLHAPIDLWIVYSIKVAECTAYYGLSYVYTHYLTEEFGMTDQEAGSLYAVYGLLCTVIGVLMGVSIDRLGVRKSMITGCVCCLVARIMTFCATTKFAVCLASVTFGPLGAAFQLPSLALAVRRYTHEENRAFAFSFFYVALCLACMLSSVIINRVRAEYLDGLLLLGFRFTWMRIVLFWCSVISVYCVVAACYVRDIQVRSDRPLEEEAYAHQGPRGRTDLRDIINQRKFWRVCGVTFIFCGVRMAFRHMDATFPKYFIRTHGHDAPFELIVGLEPLVTMVATPFATMMIVKLRMRLDQTLLVGAFISGISVFILSVEETYRSAIAFVFIIAIGEAIWSPKLYEYSTMAAPEGREGIFVAISFAPLYLSSVPVGYLSGWVLATFCPRNSAPEEKQGQLMWFIIGLTSLSSFCMLWMCRNRLFPPDDDEQSPLDTDTLQMPQMPPLSARTAREEDF